MTLSPLKGQINSWVWTGEPPPASLSPDPISQDRDGLQILSASIGDWHLSATRGVPQREQCSSRTVNRR